MVKSPRKKASQSHGNQSTVYVPVILKIFRDRYRSGATNIIFSLDDVRNAVEAVRAASDTAPRCFKWVA